MLYSDDLEIGMAHKYMSSFNPNKQKVCLSQEEKFFHFVREKKYKEACSYAEELKRANKCSNSISTFVKYIEMNLLDSNNSEEIEETEYETESSEQDEGSGEDDGKLENEDNSEEDHAEKKQNRNSNIQGKETDQEKKIKQLNMNKKYVVKSELTTMSNKIRKKVALVPDNLLRDRLSTQAISNNNNKLSPKSLFQRNHKKTEKASQKSKASQSLPKITNINKSDKLCTKIHKWNHNCRNPNCPNKNKKNRPIKTLKLMR